MKKLLLLLTASLCLNANGVITQMERVLDNEYLIYKGSQLVWIDEEPELGDIVTTHVMTGTKAVKIEVIDSMHDQWLIVLPAVAAAFVPTDLAPDLFQWLAGATEPATVNDSSTNSVNALYVNSPCATFDGVADIVDTGITNGTAGTVYTGVVYVNPTTNGTSRVMMANRVGTDGFRLFHNDTDFRVILDNGTTNITVSGTANPPQWQEVKFTFDSSTGDVEIFTNSVSIVSETHTDLIGLNPWTADTSRQLYIGGTGSGSADFAGCYAYAYCATDGTDIFRYEFCEGGGSTVYDITGNGNDGAITTGAGGLATFWGTSQDDYHYFAYNGGTKVGVYDGITSKAVGTGTDLGSGNFYYEWAGNIGTISASDYLWADGTDTGPTDYYTRCSLTDTSTLTFELDSASGTYSDTLAVTIADSDDCIIKFSRAGTNTTMYCTNLTAGAEYTDTGATAFDFSNTNDLHLMAQDANLTDGQVYWFKAGTSAGSLSHTYYSADAYGTTLPDTTGANDLTLTDVAFKQYPSLADLSNDILSLGRLNTTNVHNGGVHAIVQTGNDALTNNTFWCTGTTNYVEVTYSNLIDHVSINKGVSVKFDSSCEVVDIVTDGKSMDWLPADYASMTNWIGTSACGGGVLAPLQDGEGSDLVDTNGFLIFPTP